MELFEKALEETRASVSSQMEEEYRPIADTLKQESPRGPGRIGSSPEPEPEPETVKVET